MLCVGGPENPQDVDGEVQHPEVGQLLRDLRQLIVRHPKGPKTIKDLFQLQFFLDVNSLRPKGKFSTESEEIKRESITHVQFRDVPRRFYKIILELRMHNKIVIQFYF